MQNVEEKTAFGILSSIGPVVDYNPESLQKALCKAGFEFKDNSIDRLEKAKLWISRYNPDKNYALLNQFNAEYYDLLGQEAKSMLAELANYIQNNEFTEKDIQQHLYNVINDPNATKKENVERQKANFKHMYNMLFGRDDGPRLYLYLAAVDKENYLHLLTK